MDLDLVKSQLKSEISQRSQLIDLLVDLLGRVRMFIDKEFIFYLINI